MNSKLLLHTSKHAPQLYLMSLMNAFYPRFAMYIEAFNLFIVHKSPYRLKIRL